MADEPTGSPPLPDDHPDLEAALGPPPQDSGVDEPPERFETDTENTISSDEPTPAAPEVPETEPEETPPESNTDEAVNDIVAKEGDEVLAAEDEKVAEAFKDKPPTFKDKFKAFFKRWWRNKRLRNATIGGVLAVIAGLLAYPTTRYFILNNLSVRSSASLTVLDNSTDLPLKNVTVSLGGQSAKSDENGNVKLYHVKLGSSHLVITKRAFATIDNSHVVGWGSNPLGSYNLTPVGTQYSFEVQDFLSDKPIEKAQAESGDANAQSDKDGKILLTVDQTQAAADSLTVTIDAKGYRSETVTFNTDDKTTHHVKLVPARKEVFISKRNGKYDMYTIDLDGKNEKLLLPGTGNEQEDMTLVPHPTAEVAAYVSTRENARNTDGFLLSTLSIIDLNTGQLTKLTQSERIQVVDWIGNRLIYVAVVAGASAANPRRERLVSYDYQTNSSTDLASANYFNDVLVAGGNVYYATASTYQSSNNLGFFRSNASGSNQTRLYEQEVWNIFRTTYDSLNLAVRQQWYTYSLDTKNVTRANGAPASLHTRVYLDNPFDKNSLWVDNRDGKGTLLVYDLSKKTDKILRSQSGLQYPVRWVNATTVIYRIHTDQETADYVLNIQAGEPRKLSDVTNTAGISSWYYY